MAKPLLPRIAPLRFHLETCGPFRGPEYAGALFRGGFGKFFRDLVCVTRMPICGGCALLHSCPYSIVFETPVIPGEFTVLRKYPHAPHPFVMVPPLDGVDVVPPGHVLRLDVTLIGRGIDYLPHFILVIEAMGASGRFGGKFRVKKIVSALDAGIVVYDAEGRRIFEPPPEWRVATGGLPVRRIGLEFLTPLRIRTQGRYNPSPDFAALAQALLRRIHLLSAIYGGGEGDSSWTFPLLRQADAAVTERASFRLFTWDRMSGRQGRKVQMDGVLGSLAAEGDLTDLAPYFRMGEWVNIGSGTSMGMGRYTLTTD